MMQFDMKVDQSQLDALLKAAKGQEKSAKRYAKDAVNKTLKTVRAKMSRDQIRAETNLKAGKINRYLKVTRRAKATDLSGTITLAKAYRSSLKDFTGTRQNRRGVQYAVEKGNTRTVLSGFMGPKPGRKAAKLNGHAYKRTSRKPYPIVKLHGASAWGLYVGKDMRKQTVKDGDKVLRKNLDRAVTRAIKENWN